MDNDKQSKYYYDELKKWNRLLKADPMGAVEYYLRFRYESESAERNEAWGPIIAIGAKFKVGILDKEIFTLDPEQIYLSFLPKYKHKDVDKEKLIREIKMLDAKVRTEMKKFFGLDHHTCSPR